MRFTFVLIVLLGMSCSLPSQDDSNSLDFYKSYDQYRESAITDRRFKHRDIMDILGDLPPAFRQKQVGTSVEGRSIHLVSIGNGPVDVLLWSQMHGDEPTATMAIMDLFRFFAADDAANGFREQILNACTLHFIPMLNPDGAERFQRRNAMGVDLNRDALRLQNPEARTLKQVRDSLEPAWGFNLHDQSRYYSAGYQAKLASISFLAPAFNYQKTISKKREDAMQLIGYMNRRLQELIPDQVGKYSDAFEPRAFGDNIQKWGTRTILIEVGGMEGDPEKQELRRLHFVIFLKAFEGIATRIYESVPRSEYQKLPFNNYGAFDDLKLRNLTVYRDKKRYILDLAIRRQEVEYNNHRDWYPRGGIVDIGDLSTSFAYVDMDTEGLEAVPGQVYPQAFSHPDQILNLNLWNLVQEGYLAFRLTGPVPNDARYHNLPIKLLGGKQPYQNDIEIGANPTLFLKRGDQTEYLLVNGLLYHVPGGSTDFRRYLDGPDR